MRRKWRVRLRQEDGTEAWTVVEVRDGRIHVHRSVQTIVLGPEDMQRLRDVFREAQAAAMWDRGDW